MACETIQSLVRLGGKGCVTEAIAQDDDDWKGLDWKDSNVGKIGSDEDKAIRKQAAQAEPAWQTAGRKAGIEVWRIEAWEVIPVDPETYGKFYEGDSYIILKTTEEEGGKLTHDIHFLIGKDSTADEYGTAAYKTVELDDYFDGEPIQHREHQVEGISDSFKAMFPEMEFLEGGVDSGFKKVLMEHTTMLYQVREGKAGMALYPVPLKTSSLLPQDSFVLDAQKKVYVYHGPKTSQKDRETADKIAADLKKKREDTEVVGALNGNIHRVRLTTKCVTGADKLTKGFWAALEGDKPEWYVALVEEKRQSEAVIKHALEPHIDNAEAIYPLETLVLKSGRGLPEDVAPDKKEMHLSDDDFKKVFGTTKHEFLALPKWKQQNLKKKHNLF